MNIVVTSAATVVWNDGTLHAYFDESVIIYSDFKVKGADACNGVMKCVCSSNG